MIIAAAAAPPACYAAPRAFYAGHLRKDAEIIVVTDGPYAYTSWYDKGGGGSGGEGLFQRRGERWCKVVNGGGAMSRAEIEHYGVPPAIARRLFEKMRRARG